MVSLVSHRDGEASRLLHKKGAYDSLFSARSWEPPIFPSRDDIYNIMYRASIQMRHSKIGQEEVAHKIAEWLQESPQDKFVLRLSTRRF